MEPTLDEVRQELSSVYEELLNTPPDHFEKRIELKERQNELRQLSHRLIEGQPLHDAGSLKAAYKRLEQVRDRLLDKHLGQYSNSAGDAGVDATFINAVNRAMDSGLGVDEIESRMAEIIQQLKSSR